MRRAVFGVTVAVAVAGGAVLATQDGPADARPERRDRLTAFTGCAGFLRHVRARALPAVGPYGLPGAMRGVPVFAEDAVVHGAAAGAPAAARAGGSVEGAGHSGTNVQEAGVGEPDTAVTDGAVLYTVAGGRLRAVAVGDGRPRALGTLAMDDIAGARLLLDGDRLLVTGADARAGGGGGGPAIDGPAGPSWTVVRQVDVADPRAMRVAATLRVEGGLLAARATGGTVRVVTTAPADPAPVTTPAAPGVRAEAAATARNRAAVAAAPARAWLPAYRVGAGRGLRAAARPVAGCAQVSRPPVASGLGTVTVLTLDPARGLDPVDRDVVLADADTVYASATGLYVATSPWTAVTAGVTASPAAGGGVTRLHRFDIADPRVTRYAASGRVTGTLLGQWSMSEHEGVLRVASTREPGWGPGGRAGEASEALVTTLRPRGGALVPVGRLGGLGRGERLVGVRFMGGTGYLVTFRQTDPLWVVDLSDPARPRVRGELTLPGYSAYLHPVGDGLLLGIGQDADARGRTLGTKVSLFDVTDPGRPALLDDVRLDGAWSEAEADHQAVLWWAPRDLLAVPVTDPSGAGNRAVGVRLRGRALVRAGEVRQPVAPHGWAPPVTRILVAGGALLAVSEAGVRAAALDEDLTPGPWLAFG